MREDKVVLQQRSAEKCILGIERAHFICGQWKGGRIERAFRRVLEQKNQISKLQSDTQMRQKELGAINNDQARIRENMKALKGSVEEKALLARYTRQLDSQEDRLNLLHKELAVLGEKQALEQQMLEDMVQQITL